MTEVLIGLELFEGNKPSGLDHAKLGVLSNSASLDSDLNFTWQVVDRVLPGQIKALFSPQHGYYADAQANMIETGHGWHRQLEIPIYSLYSETRCPTKEMSEQLDWLVIDLQDVGTRVYTFIWTMLECMRHCASEGISVLVLDRPNPLGGCVVEGPILDPDYRSFVGGWDIPMRHGLTIGELAKLFQLEEQMDLDLHVVSMSGWETACSWAKTGRRWVPPSPNLPTLDSVLLYPGQVLLEGTNISEGRGTTLPFELIGAPYVNSDSLSEALNQIGDQSFRVLPTRFRPTFDKWAGEDCGGVSIHIKNADEFRSFSFTLQALREIQKTCAEFRWNDPPYEYENHRMPIDILFGDHRLREQIGSVEIGMLAQVRLLAKWHERIEDVLIYRGAGRCVKL